MWSKVCDYMKNNRSISYYIDDESVFYKVAFVFLCVIWSLLYGLAWIFLFVTCPIWVLPYLILSKKL